MFLLPKLFLFAHDIISYPSFFVNVACCQSQTLLLSFLLQNAISCPERAFIRLTKLLSYHSRCVCVCVHTPNGIERKRKGEQKRLSECRRLFTLLSSEKTLEVLTSRVLPSVPNPRNKCASSERIAFVCYSSADVS